MDTFMGFLSFVLFITLIIGLIKPKIILRWSKKPTRLKVVGYWMLIVMLLGIFHSLTLNEEAAANKSIKSAKKYIEQEKYGYAISELEGIKIENPFYAEAQKLLQITDSLIKKREEEKIFEKEAEAKRKAEEERVSQKEQLERELKSIGDGIDFSKYRGTVNDLQMEIVLFGVWANIIEGGEASKDEEIKNLTSKLKNRVIKIQAREFPKLRKGYAQVISSLIWENDITVTATGPGYKYINFTGGVFAANKNKQDFQNKVYEILKTFRFDQSRYRWYSGDNEYTYWKLQSKKDTDLVTFD